MRPEWWLQRNLRMLQMNLREHDFPLDVAKYLREARAYQAEALLFNAGGIVANYPSRLPFHAKNPHLSGDPLKAVAEGAQRLGMKLVARFDFSKVQAALGRKHPDWLYKSLKGKPVEYNGTLHTCINGAYQQQRIFEILDEALSNYPIDGIFINMFGYFTWDYSHVYHGICQCAACRRRFGEALPRKEDPRDPRFRRYQEFCRVTASELGQRLGRFLKARHPGTASLSYDYGGADVKCNESNSDTDRSLPEWNYSASDNVKRTLGSFAGMPACNADISFAGHACRHLGVSPHLNALRLVQDLIHGGWLWFVVIGPTWQQADRSSLGPAKKILGFHADQIRWLGRTVSAAEVLLVNAGDGAYKGLFRILSENQLPFDAIEGFRLGEPGLPRSLASYKAIVVPEVGDLGPEARRALDAYVHGGGKLLSMGAEGPSLKCLGLKAAGPTLPAKPGRYLRLVPADKRFFKAPGLEDLDLLYLNTAFNPCAPRRGTRAFLPLIPDTMFGPPEKCRPGQAGRQRGAFATTHGKGRAIHFPWSLGAHYEPRFFIGHRALLMAALRALGADSGRLKVKAHALLEISHQADPQGRFEWVGLVNHSGQNGSAFHAPLPLGGVVLKIKPAHPVKAARLLQAGRTLKPRRRPGGWLEYRLPAIDRFEILLLEESHG
jgi:hypothetical protein